MDDAMTKPPDCKCDFPDVIAKNMCGHDRDCPAYHRWCREIGDNPSLASPSAESKPAPAIEDRGTAAWIFEGEDERLRRALRLLLAEPCRCTDQPCTSCEVAYALRDCGCSEFIDKVKPR